MMNGGAVIVDFFHTSYTRVNPPVLCLGDSTYSKRCIPHSCGIKRSSPPKNFLRFQEFPRIFLTRAREGLLVMALQVSQIRTSEPIQRENRSIAGAAFLRIVAAAEFVVNQIPVVFQGVSLSWSIVC